MIHISKHIRNNIIGYLALFIALGGTSYAVGLINGKNIKNRTIAGKKIKKHSITGVEVKASKLRNVESARNSFKLEGLESDEFMRNNRIEYGYGSVSSATKVTLLSWPEFGVSVTTDGETEDYTEILITNSSSTNVRFIYRDGEKEISSGASLQVAKSGDSTFEGLIMNPLTPERAYWISCAFPTSSTIVACFGVRSA